MNSWSLVHSLSVNLPQRSIKFSRLSKAVLKVSEVVVIVMATCSNLMANLVYELTVKFEDKGLTATPSAVQKCGSQGLAVD